ncbi:hypothetical protein [Pseudogemmobacter sp. W21_MBD1_M6]|uniref:hypothetical protein n=1 Tax=Pseudogemmobacter sp. W21_MBD1_M6 TaxID=3240271 RepID=UPI003F96B80C
MANENNRNTTALAFIVGALVVVVAVLAYFMLGGDVPGDTTDIKIELPNIQTN